MKEWGKEGVKEGNHNGYEERDQGKRIWKDRPRIDEGGRNEEILI